MFFAHHFEFWIICLPFGSKESLFYTILSALRQRNFSPIFIEISLISSSNFGILYNIKYDIYKFKVGENRVKVYFYYIEYLRKLLKKSNKMINDFYIEIE